MFLLEATWGQDWSWGLYHWIFYLASAACFVSFFVCCFVSFAEWRIKCNIKMMFNLRSRRWWRAALPGLSAFHESAATHTWWPSEQGDRHRRRCTGQHQHVVVWRVHCRIRGRSDCGYLWDWWQWSQRQWLGWRTAAPRCPQRPLAAVDCMTSWVVLRHTGYRHLGWFLSWVEGLFLYITWYYVKRTTV